MARNIPEKLKYFFKNALRDLDDGYEYSSELRRILNSDECQTALSDKEIEKLKDFAEDVKKTGEINYYTEQRIKELEKEHFGAAGVEGFLESKSAPPKPQWPF